MRDDYIELKRTAGTFNARYCVANLFYELVFIFDENITFETETSECLDRFENSFYEISCTSNKSQLDLAVKGPDGFSDG